MSGVRLDDEALSLRKRGRAMVDDEHRCGGMAVRTHGRRKISLYASAPGYMLAGSPSPRSLALMIVSARRVPT
jgi:hypothetical protein